MLHLKTQQEVEADFYHFIEDSAIGETIEGSVYRDGMRPDDAKTEDAVVKMLAGEDSLLQTGVVICNIYVRDVLSKNGGRVANLNRIAQLQRAVHRFVDDWTCEDYYQIRTDDTMEVVQAEDIDQHYIYVRFRFYRRAS